MNCFEGQEKEEVEEKWNFKSRSYLLYRIPWAWKHEKTFVFSGLFFCQRQQLCSFLRGLRLYVRSWTIISICSVTLDRVKSKWLSSLKSARKLRSNIDAALVFSFSSFWNQKKLCFVFSKIFYLIYEALKFYLPWWLGHNSKITSANV